MADLQEITEYLRNEAPDFYQRWLNELFAVLDDLAINPLLFQPDPLRNENDGSFRSFFVSNYRITYAIIDREKIAVLRIRHTSREPLSY